MKTEEILEGGGGGGARSGAINITRVAALNLIREIQWSTIFKFSYTCSINFSFNTF